MRRSGIGMIVAVTCLSLASWATAQPAPVLEPILQPSPAPISLPDPLEVPGLPKLDGPLPLPAKPVKAVKPVAPVQSGPIDMPLDVPMLPTLPTNTPKTADPKPLPELKPVVSSPIEIKAAPLEAIGQPAVVMPAASDSAQSMARQEPAVVVEWVGPGALKVGQPALYVLSVRNTCSSPVQKVVLQARIGGAAKVVATEPKGDGAENTFLWELGTMMPKQERSIKVKLAASGKGELGCQAWVTFTGTAIAKMVVREPKLLVKVKAPEKGMVGDPINVTMEVSNPGDHPAESVKLTATLADGLESLRGNKIAHEVGMLAPGETRTIQLPCAAKASGSQKCEVYVEGSDGLRAFDSVAVLVMQPKLGLDVSGPKKRYLGRPAVYSFKVSNPGDAPAKNVFVTELIPVGFKYSKADSAGQHDAVTRQVKWFIAEIAPGESKEVTVELIATTAGDHKHKVSATSTRGASAEGEVATQVEGVSAISMEVRDTDDPVEVGADTTYEIVIANTGSQPETDLKLTCTLPPQMKLKTIEGPVRYTLTGADINFEPVPKLAARGDMVFRVRVSAIADGDARFKAQLTSKNLVDPVVKVESTRVYKD